jgi:hypothetical protein
MVRKETAKILKVKSDEEITVDPGDTSSWTVEGHSVSSSPGTNST